MSDEDAIRAAFASWNERGIDGFLEHTTPDIVWHAPPDYPEAQEWHGREAIGRDWRSQFDSVFENVHTELESIEAGPGGHLAAVRGRGRAKGSGIELDWRSYFVGHLAGNLWEELWIFNNEAEARRQAGLDAE